MSARPLALQSGAATRRLQIRSLNTTRCCKALHYNEAQTVPGINRAQPQGLTCLPLQRVDLSWPTRYGKTAFDIHVPVSFWPRITRLQTMNIDYLKKILTARVYDAATETPLELAPALSQRLGNQIISSAKTCKACSASRYAALTTRWPSSAMRNANGASFARRPATMPRAWPCRQRAWAAVPSSSCRPP